MSLFIHIKYLLISSYLTPLQIKTKLNVSLTDIFHRLQEKTEKNVHKHNIKTIKKV